jgi:dihydrofolate synthase/folylpolyglutamate synthase
LTDESTPLPRTRKPCSRQFHNKSNFTHDDTNQLTTSVGKYISPHLISVTERISVNGIDISQEDFNGLWAELYGGSYDTNAYQSEIRDPQARLYRQSLTEFEKLTILAFEHFKRSKVDIAILEVGLGGRLDATNILSPEHTLATAITNIGLDHQEYLGSTIEEISREKRGIIKPSVPHYEGMLTAQPPNDIQGSNFLLAKQIFEAITGSSFSTRDDELKHVFNQRYKARFDESEAGAIVDGAHNPNGASELNRYLRNKYPSQPKIWIIGMLDKDHESFLDNLFYKLLNHELDVVIFTRVNNSRSKDPNKLKESILQQYPELKTYNCEQLEEALAKAAKLKQNQLLIVTGSLYLCGEYLSQRN